MKTSEQDVAAVVVAYLEALGADVYQEVEVSGGVADIVARVGAELWIVEVKTSLSLALLVQAMSRRRHAHRVFVAAPYSRTLGEFSDVARELGIGVLRVRTGDFDASWSTERPDVKLEVESRRWNTRPVKLATKLKPQHKTHAKAGAVGAAGRWTPFRDTCEQLASRVRAVPGITLKSAIAEIRHHYSSKSAARSSLAKWIIDGKVPGVRARVGAEGTLALYPSEAVA